MKKLLPASMVMLRGPALPMPVLYLTFDDGPHPEVTPQILDVLKEFSAKATFFVIGENVEKQPDLARRIHEDGHRLANHSMRHKQFATMTVANQLNEIEKTEELLKKIAGERRFLFRPPQGTITFQLLFRLVIRRTKTILWSIDSNDYKGGTVESIVEGVDRSLPGDRDVLLFHDDNPATPAALRKLLAKWSASGLLCMPLSDEGA